MINYGRWFPGLGGIVAAGMLAGCFSEHYVTTRPEFAYPQSLISLCSDPATLHLANQGVFVTRLGSSETADYLLLSALMLPEKPEQQHAYEHMQIDIGADLSVTVTAYDRHGRSSMNTFSGEQTRCSPEGELQIERPGSIYYLWATVGKKSSVMALWTNAEQGLVLQNRWRERIGGIIGGTGSGDAWASFSAQAKRSFDPTTNAQAPGLVDGTCPALTDDYAPVARITHSDGSLAKRTAVDQFFRAELIGEQPVNQESRIGSRFSIMAEEDHGLTLSLHEEAQLLGTRHIAGRDITCEEGRWHIRGKRELKSPWMLLLASGGVSWEDLTLWRDPNGDLLVEGVHKERNALFLIPIGGTQTLFMVFPKRSADPGPADLNRKAEFDQ